MTRQVEDASAQDALDAPFWTQNTHLRANELWLPSHTDSNAPTPRPLLNSWFTASQTQTTSTLPRRDYEAACSELQPCASKNVTDYLRKKSDKIGGVQKVRLYPTAEETTKLRQWMGTTRWTYNQCVELVKNKNKDPKLNELRALCVHNNVFKSSDKQWVLATPYMVRDEGLRDFMKAFKYQIKRVGLRNAKSQLQFRSRKTASSTVVIHARHWTNSRGVFAFLKSIRSSEPLPSQLLTDTRLQMNTLGEFFLCVIVSPRTYEASAGDVLALDPGVRTFQTCYNPNGALTEIGRRDIEKCVKQCHRWSFLQSKAARGKTTHKHRYRLRKKMRRIQKRLKNLITDVHNKTIKWMLDHHSVILIPCFGTQRMVLREGSLKKATRWALSTWSHFLFRSRLISKSMQYPKTKVFVVNEAFTSRTCTRCGSLNAKTSSKELRCENCALQIDRDANGARNIFLKFAQEQDL